MRHRFAWILVGLMAATPCLAAEIKWAKGWDAAVEAAKNSKRLIMIDFYTDWCGWCKKLDADTYPNPKVVAYSANFVPLKLDAEKEGEKLAQKYKVTGYPSILFVDATGEIFGEIGGYMPPAEFLVEMTKINERYAAYPSIAAKLKSSPNDGEANAKIVPILAAQRKVNDAVDALDRSVKAGYRGPHLAKAYNAVGDAFQSAEKFDKAITVFISAIASAKENEDKSYAKMSIMYCYMGKGDMDNARKAAKELIAMPGATQEHIALAKELLKELGGGG